MRLLVTNDDGVWAPGIHALARALADDGHDLLVAAPLDDRSGSSAAIGMLHVDETIDVQPVDLPGLDGVGCYGVSGPPALAVLAARLGGFGEPPELVVSGVNPGPNTGRAVLHSGTVGAALTAANFGAKGLAVSMEVGEPQRWATATRLASAAVAWLSQAPPLTVLNLNVPNVDLPDLRGVRWARLAPFGTVRAAVVEAEDGGLQMELSAHEEQLPSDTDSALVTAGYAAVTAIEGVRAREEIDVAAWIERRAQRRSA